MYFRHFNQNHLKSDAGRIGWLRQVEALTELYDYSLLLECTQNYACEVKVKNPAKISWKIQLTTKLRKTHFDDVQA